MTEKEITSTEQLSLHDIVEIQKNKQETDHGLIVGFPKETAGEYTFQKNNMETDVARHQSVPKDEEIVEIKYSKLYNTENLPTHFGKYVYALPISKINKKITTTQQLRTAIE